MSNQESIIYEDSKNCCNSREMYDKDGYMDMVTPFRSLMTSEMVNSFRFGSQISWLACGS